MNKNLLLVGAVAVASYMTLTAFGGKTKAEQLAEIQSKVQMGLEDIRTEEKAKCDASVADAVEAKYNEMVAATPEPAAVPGKKTGKGGPKVKPLPTGKAGTENPPGKTRDGATKPGGEVKERGGSVPQSTTPPPVKTRGGATKQGGGK